MDYIRNPLSAVGSSISLGSSRRNYPNKDDLLDLCDDVRASLVHNKSLNPRWEEAMDFLKTTLEDEHTGMDNIPLARIEYAHLDKLLCDIINPSNRPKPTPARFRDDVALAEILQKEWRARFRELYFSIGHDRYPNLTTTGRLRNVVFNNESTSSLDPWKPTTAEELSEREGNLEFEPGHWWLNLACANRDGIVSSVRETPTRGKYGVTTLPLLFGKEGVHAGSHICEFMKEGRISDMHVSLLTQVGNRIRILRGHRLESPIAPRAGIRYDGVYILRQYGQRYNEHTNLHRVRLTLERVADQRPIDQVLKIPRPSDLDDWNLFQKFESNVIKAKKGDRGLLEWKRQRILEEAKRAQYRRDISFQAAMELERTRVAKKAMEESDKPSKEMDDGDGNVFE
ncbi:Fc.00g109620.m01.CDS01 [Cosmosporella sp. VM-42]